MTNIQTRISRIEKEMAEGDKNRSFVARLEASVQRAEEAILREKAKRRGMMHQKGGEWKQKVTKNLPPGN
jgi:hypothetical protein